MLKSNKIYMDYASSIEANPSSIHFFGMEAKKKLQDARNAVAGALSAQPEEIIFTSGGTESNNLAILGMAYPYLTSPYSRGRKKEGVIPHLITTNIEHPSVLETFKLLAQRKLARISIIPVETSGLVDPEKIKKEIKKNTVLISVHYANNEIGVIQPIREIAKVVRQYKKTNLSRLWHPLLNKERARERFPIFHTDAVQAANYLDLNVKRRGVDMLSLSGSKIFGAGRVGALYKRKSVRLAKIFGGGDQEFGLRPGTENLPEILKFSSAFQSAQKIKEKETKRLTILRDYFIKKLLEMSKAGFGKKMSRTVLDTQLVINGDLEKRLPNNINITIPDIPGDLLVIELSARGIMASAKSACKSGDGQASYVIEAIRKIQDNPPASLREALRAGTLNEENGSLRFSLGRETTKRDIDYTVKSLSKILTKLKKWYD